MARYLGAPLLLVLSLSACTGDSSSDDAGSEGTSGEESGDEGSTEAGDGDGDMGAAELEWILHLESDAAGINEIEERGGELILAGSFYGDTLTVDGQMVEGGGTRAAFLGVLDGSSGSVNDLESLSGSATDFVSLRAVEVEEDGSLTGTLYHRSPVEFGGATLPGSGTDERGHIISWAADGTEDWFVGFGADAKIQVAPEGLHTNGDGTWLAVGSFLGPLDLGGGDLGYGKPAGVFGAQIAQDGTISQAWGGGGDSVSVADSNIRADGSTLLAGQFDESFDFVELVTDFSSGYFMQVSEEGAVQWVHGAYSASADAIAPAADGGAYLGGQFREGLNLGGQAVEAPADDGYYARVASDGTVLWVKRLGNDVFGIVHEMVETEDGLWIAGKVRSPHPLDGDNTGGAGDDDNFIARANPDTGDIYWIELLGGPGVENWSGVWADEAGSIYLAGQTSGMSYGGVDIQPDGDEIHGFLAKFSPT